jgi:hypothetical protein
LQQSIALLDAAVIIVHAAIHLALKFVLDGGPLVGKNIFSGKTTSLAVSSCLCTSRRMPSSMLTA